MQATSALEFPCQFPIKVIGDRHDDLAQVMTEIVLRHVPDFDASSVAMKASSTGRYLALTFTITACSREQLDNLYIELSGHPLARMVL